MIIDDLKKLNGVKVLDYNLPVNIEKLDNSNLLV